MRIKNIKILLFLIVISQGLQAQGLRFSLRLGVSIPGEAFAKVDAQPELGGFAMTGFNMNFVASRTFENNFLTGINFGYNVNGLDKSAIAALVNPSNPDLVSVETQSFQNLNLQFMGGYNIKLGEGKWNIIPQIAAGMGVFNSAYYAIQNNGGDTLLRKGGSDISLLVTPGLTVAFSINDFLQLDLYSNYQWANYQIKEELRVVGVSDPVNRLVDYKYRMISAGLGLTIRL